MAAWAVKKGCKAAGQTALNIKPARSIVKPSQHLAGILGFDDFISLS